MERIQLELEQGAVDILVKAGSRKNLIEFDSKKGFIISIKEKAENGKANFEIERFLSKICSRDVKILLGKTSKKKKVIYS